MSVLAGAVWPRLRAAAWRHGVNNFSDVNTELIDEANDEIKKGNINEVETIAE